MSALPEAMPDHSPRQEFAWQRAKVTQEVDTDKHFTTVALHLGMIADSKRGAG
jgi:hypothetical protein